MFAAISSHEKESVRELRRSVVYWSNGASESRVDSEVYVSYGGALSCCNAATLRVKVVGKEQHRVIASCTVKSEVKQDFSTQESILSLAVNRWVKNRKKEQTPTGSWVRE